VGLTGGAAQTIEIGLGYGISALHVCEGLLANADPTARHVVIDPYQAMRFSNCAGGVVFVDDYQLSAIARAASFCLTNLGWTLEEVSAADDFHQWAVLRTSAVPDTRPFDYYIDF
jgi:hypothetical protein